MPKTLRVAIGGIWTESSTFSDRATRRDDFLVLVGQELLDTRYPFLAGSQYEVEWVPLLHARALPGGPVEAAAYEELAQTLFAMLEHNGSFDAVLLDIHGAMTVVGHTDIEGELAGNLRQLVGPDVLIATAQDLHGNPSSKLTEAVDLITAYRSAPHIDEEATSLRACQQIVACLVGRYRPWRARVALPLLLTGEQSSTTVEPGRGLYADVTVAAGLPNIIDASVWIGYAWADEPRSHVTTVVTGIEPTAVRSVAERLARRFWDARVEFSFVAPNGSAQECVSLALATHDRPVFISDSGDNPTAGGNGDSAFMLNVLLAETTLRSGARRAILASILDPTYVERCRRAGANGHGDGPVGAPLDGGRRVHLTGPIIRTVDDAVGGPTVIVRCGGIEVAVTSRVKPFHRRRDFGALGLNPASADLTVVKLGYLEPELASWAATSMLALSPGPVSQDLASLRYERLQRPIFPLDGFFETPPLEAEMWPPRAHR